MMMVEASKKRAKNSRRYDTDVMMRILDAMYEMGHCGITKIAVHAGLNNQTCKRYLHLMNVLEWTRAEKGGRYGLVLGLTETGLGVRDRLQGMHDTGIWKQMG